jgi:hypothetical protein
VDCARREVRVSVMTESDEDDVGSIATPRDGGVSSYDLVVFDHGIVGLPADTKAANRGIDHSAVGRKER